MLKILVPVDGSETADRAVNHLLKLMDRFPVVITLGAALLGWIGGGMLVGDVVVKPYLEGAPSWLHFVTSVAGAALVVLLGGWLAKRAQRETAPLVELAVESGTKAPSGDN